MVESDDSQTTDILLPMSTIRLVIALALFGTLTACTGDSTGQGPVAEEQCQGRGKNLLQDPQFQTVDAPRRERKWSSSEHAAGQSFKYSVSNGELLIEKTGIEPWFIMTQILSREDIPGRKVVFSAEIKLDMQPPAIPHGFKQGGGLTINAMANGKPVVRSLMEHEPHMGTTDWQPVQVVVDLPKRIESVRLGFIHQADGSISIRKPSLQRVAKGDCEG